MTESEKISGPAVLHRGDCRFLIKDTHCETYDAIITDPPYALDSIVKRFGKAGSAPAKGDNYNRVARRFEGQTWDTGDVVFSDEFWFQARYVLKPGGHVAAFAATRNYHRLADAIESAGLEIRDMIVWLYGTGMPKSHNIGRLAANAGDTETADRFRGWGTSLKPMFEPIIIARKPLVGTLAENHKAHGVGGLNIDEAKQGDKWPQNAIHDGTVDLPPFFYCAKPSTREREGNDHPTVKPLALMEWLIKLLTEPGGLVLDPFAGSGTTGVAAIRVGREYQLAEANPDYWPIIERRIALAEYSAEADGRLEQLELF